MRAVLYYYTPYLNTKGLGRRMNGVRAITRIKAAMPYRNSHGSRRRHQMISTEVCSDWTGVGAWLTPR